MRAALVVIAALWTGCAVAAVGASHVAHGDRLAVDGDLAGALRAYDAALWAGAIGDIALRARAGRATVTAAQSTAAELERTRGAVARLREEIAAREREVAKLRGELAARETDLVARDGEVTKLTREVATREGELARVRQDLTARQAEIVRLGVEAEKLRGDLEALKRLEMPLEKRRP
jgi:hypothetical protein